MDRWTDREIERNRKRKNYAVGVQEKKGDKRYEAENGYENHN